MKKLVIAAAFVCAASCAYAQEKEFTITVTISELNIISEGLGTQPFKQVVPLMDKLRQQVMKQQQPPEPPKAVDKPPEAPKP